MNENRQIILYVDQFFYFSEPVVRVHQSEPLLRIGNMFFHVTLHPQAKAFIESMRNLKLPCGSWVDYHCTDPLTKQVLNKLLNFEENNIYGAYKRWYYHGDVLLVGDTAPIYTNAFLQRYRGVFPHPDMELDFEARVLAPLIQAKTPAGQALVNHYFRLPEFVPGKLPIADLLQTADEIKAQAHTLYKAQATKPFMCCLGARPYKESEEEHAPESGPGPA